MTVFSHGYYARSDDASFIIVSGAETIEFLQSILTANIATMPIGSCRPAALLTPQGRILIDMMVYRPSDAEIYLQTDNARSADLLARLRRYRLRRPVNLEPSDDMQLTLWWGYDGTSAPEDPRIFRIHGMPIWAAVLSVQGAVPASVPAPICRQHWIQPKLFHMTIGMPAALPRPSRKGRLIYSRNAP